MTQLCDYVAHYLDRFLDDEARATVDLEQVSRHVSTCPACYSRLSHFFRTIELPESAYLKETLDELALALYNLGKAIIRDRPAASLDDDTENVHITEPGGGSASDNVEAGVEMIEDAEDYSGSSRVGGMDLAHLRELLHDAESSRVMKIDLAISVFRPITEMECRYTSEAWNWLGVLYLKKGALAEAEGAFLKVLTAPDGARNVRALAHCNLGYVFKHKDDLDRAVRAAERAVALSRIDGKDEYFGRLAALYFLLLRKKEGDLDLAREHLDAILKGTDGAVRIRRELSMAANAPMLDAFKASPLGQERPDLAV